MHKWPFLKGLIENKPQCFGGFFVWFCCGLFFFFFNPNKRILSENNK